jgi:hypothetical protein
MASISNNNNNIILMDDSPSEVIATEVVTVQAASDYWKKAGCAVTGGFITAVGLVMIPAPTPCGMLFLFVLFGR